MHDFRGEPLSLDEAIQLLEVITPALLYFYIPPIDALASARMSVSPNFRLHPSIGRRRQKYIVIRLSRTRDLDVASLVPSVSLKAHFISEIAQTFNNRSPDEETIPALGLSIG